MAKAKTASFATIHFTIAFTVAYLLTGSLLVGGALAIIEPALNTVAYYFHEKFWQGFSALPDAARLSVFAAD